jgi:hypothetical protein
MIYIIKIFNFPQDGYGQQVEFKEFPKLFTPPNPPKYSFWPYPSNTFKGGSSCGPRYLF